MRRLAPIALGLPLLLAACEMPSPQAPAEPIGEYPVWGQNFGQQNSQPAGAGSLLSGEGPAPSDTPDNAEASGGGGSTTPNMPNTFSSSDWSGGDADYGRQVFLNNCARCHGPEGKGGELPGIGKVPTLADPAWQQKTSDGAIASTIAHGKGTMPSFMQQLDKRELSGLIAFIRTLAK